MKLKSIFRLALVCFTTLLAVSCRRSDPGYGRGPNETVNAVEVVNSGEPPGAELSGPSGSTPEVRTLAPGRLPVGARPGGPPPGAGRSGAPRERRVITNTNPNVMRVHYDGAGNPLDDGRVVRAGTPANRKIRPAGENEAVVIGPDGSVLTAPAGVVVSPDKLAAIMAHQGQYREPSPPTRRR